MPVFTYKALSEQGGTLNGEEAAESVEALALELQGRGLLVQEVRRKRGSGIRIFQRRRVRAEEFLLFCQEITALLKAGLTVTDALSLAAVRPSQPMMRHVLQRLTEDIRGGIQFSTACERHPEVFDALFVSSLKTGEKTGDLVSVLKRYQAFLKRKIALNKKLAQALAYPAFLLVTLAVVLGVLFAFVMPRFIEMYADFDAELPAATRFLLGLVEHLLETVAIASAVALLGGLTYRGWAATEHGRVRMDEFKTRVPFLGGFVQELAVAQVARTLATLLTGGMGLVDAMRTTTRTISNRAYAQRLAIATQSVIEGRSLSDAFKAADVMPSTAAKMVEAGEASGQLGELLAEVAGFYEENVEYRLTRMMALIEPALMLLMGVLVGGIIIVMYLPVFSIANVIQ